MQVTTADTNNRIRGRTLAIYTSEEIIAEAARHGSYYFGKDERRFFGSKAYPRVTAWDGGFLFVESCKPPSGPRFYRVLVWRPFEPRDFNRIYREGERNNGLYGTVFSTLRQAESFIKRIAEGTEKVEEA